MHFHCCFFSFGSNYVEPSFESKALTTETILCHWYTPPQTISAAGNTKKIERFLIALVSLAKLQVLLRTFQNKIGVWIFLLILKLIIIIFEILFLCLEGHKFCNFQCTVKFFFANFCQYIFLKAQKILELCFWTFNIGKLFAVLFNQIRMYFSKYDSSTTIRQIQHYILKGR